MTDSMTAFSRTEFSADYGDMSLELRSVNHRYLEISFRLPEEMRRFEPHFRQLIAGRLSRGRVDVNLRFRPLAAAQSISINATAVGQVALAGSKLQEAIPGIKALRAIDVLGWPGVVEAPDLEIDRLGEDAGSLVEAGLKELVDVRRREGEALDRLIVERLKEINEIVEDLRPIQPEIKQRLRDRLEERIGALRDEGNPERFEQEVMLLVQKADVDEELDRLMVHVREVAKVLKQSKPIGRRLDFLMQELNREANTLGSKAADPRVTTASVDLKVLIEQIREQVQNVE